VKPARIFVSLSFILMYIFLTDQWGRKKDQKLRAKHATLAANRRPWLTSLRPGQRTGEAIPTTPRLPFGSKASALGCKKGLVSLRRLGWHFLKLDDISIS